MFSPDSFGELSSTYVLNAVRHGQDLRRKELHEQELAVANLSALTANINRDTKKNKKPFSALDFCYFADKEDRNDPDAINAAAYMKLISDGKMPSWALFCYQDMKGLATESAAPNPPALTGDGFLLLAPEPASGGMEGLLLAQGRASGKTIRGFWGKQVLTVQIPEFEGIVIAREHMLLRVV